MSRLQVGVAKRLFFLFTLSLFSAGAVSCSNNGTEPIDFSAFATPEAKALALAEQFPGISVTVIQDDQTLWEWAHGYADVESETAVTSETRFNIYSVSKMVSGMAFASLHHDGVLDLQTDITSIAPDLPSHYQGITLEHLLSHRSGIRHYKRGNDWKTFSERRCATTQDGVDYFAEDPLEFTPGTDQLYSTLGMVLASHVLVEATGADSFTDALNRTLKAEESFLLDSDTISKATPYKSGRNGFQPINAINAECKFAGGGLVASSGQLARLGASFIKGEIIPADQLRPMMIDTKPEGHRFRFAMQTGQSEDLNSSYASMRGGATGGRAMLVVLPDAKLSIAVAANAEGEGGDVSAFIVSLAKYFLEEGSE